MKHKSGLLTLLAIFCSKSKVKIKADGFARAIAGMYISPNKASIG
jgi:hypothetical protein